MARRPAEDLTPYEGLTFGAPLERDDAEEDADAQLGVVTLDEMDRQRRAHWYWAAAFGAVGLVLWWSTRGTQKAAPAPTNAITVNRDPALLLPTFRAHLDTLFQRLIARGFDPYLFEGYRSPARAKYLAQQGKGIVKSLHCLGAAADVTSVKNGWDDPQFFAALGEEAEKLGLVWGGRFGDLNHLQAVPERDAAALWAAAPADRDRMIAARIT